VLVSLPTIPAVVSEMGSRLYMGLGLGDFFFFPRVQGVAFLHPIRNLSLIAEKTATQNTTF
jgi:hypothetical protein